MWPWASVLVTSVAGTVFRDVTVSPRSLVVVSSVTMLV